MFVLFAFPFRLTQAFFILYNSLLVEIRSQATSVSADKSFHDKNRSEHKATLQPTRSFEGPPQFSFHPQGFSHSLIFLVRHAKLIKTEQSIFLRGVCIIC